MSEKVFVTASLDVSDSNSSNYKKKQQETNNGMNIGKIFSMCNMETQSLLGSSLGNDSILTERDLGKINKQLQSSTAEVNPTISL